MKDFTRYLEVKNLAPSTIHSYIKSIAAFFNWYQQEPTNCTKKDILNYLHHLKEKQLQNTSRNSQLKVLKHYFDFLLQRQAITHNPTLLLKIRGIKRKKLYKLFTADELTELVDAYYQSFIRNFDDRYIPAPQRNLCFLGYHRNYIMLSLLVHQGLASNELLTICLDEVDFNKAKLHVKGRKRSEGRNVPLHATQIGDLMYYIHHIRDQFFDYCLPTDKLFFVLPQSGKKYTTAEYSRGLMFNFSRQVRTLHPSFLNFKQIRASVITHWLQQHGLRKTQYLAGHRYISSTEQYLSSDIESLMEDMSQFNPF